MKDLHDRASAEIEEEERRKKRILAITDASRGGNGGSGPSVNNSSEFKSKN